MHDALSGRNRATYGPYSEEQRYEVAQQIKAYCAGTIDSIEVVNLRHISEVMQQFKILYNNAAEEAKRGGGGGGGDAAQAGGQDGDGLAANTDGGVGELVGGGGGSIGRAPDAAKPLVSVKGSGAGGAVSPQREADKSMAASPKRQHQNKEGGAVPDKNQAFEVFKESDGKDLNKVLRENTASLKEKRQKQKDLALSINTCKKQIDELKESLELRREQVQEGQTDDEEFVIVRSLKAAKGEYRQAFEDLKAHILKKKTL